jgi:transposase, IS5 family
MGGSIVDATIIHASASTKKGNTWHFGMKAHISVDAKSGLVHTVGVTTARTHDAKVIDQLIREDDEAIFGDKDYVNEKLKAAARQAGVYWAVLEKAKPKKKRSSSQRKRNKKHASVRAKVEHVFRIIKCQFGYRKTRYRGIEKNGAQVFALMALANLYQIRDKLLQGAG